MTEELFGTTQEKKETKREIKRTQFLDLKTSATIRILDESYVKEDTHYLNRATVKCLGDECPICQNNKLIIMNNPDEFREDPLYNSRRTVYMVNVLDRTPTRVCSGCQQENRNEGGDQSAKRCSGCSNILTDEAKPLNKVKVLSRGVTLFEHLGSIRNAILDSAGEKVGITNYDLTLMVSGTGKDKTITPVPGQTVPLNVEVNQEDLFDLTKVVIKLDGLELLDLQKGISLKDIFSARKASQNIADFKSEDFLSEDSASKAKSAVDELFG